MKFTLYQETIHLANTLNEHTWSSGYIENSKNSWYLVTSTDVTDFIESNTEIYHILYITLSGFLINKL